MELNRNKHSVEEASYHIVFCPKYRHGIFGYERLRKFCIYLFMRVADRHKVIIRALEVMDDHVHLFVSIRSVHSISQVARYFKGYSAYKMFKVFPWLKEYKPGEPRFWGGHFWSRGYFYRSVGSTTDKAVEFYIKLSQHKEQRDKYYCIAGSKQEPTNEDPYISYLQGKLNFLPRSQTILETFVS